MNSNIVTSTLKDHQREAFQTIAAAQAANKQLKIISDSAVSEVTAVQQTAEKLLSDAERQVRQVSKISQDIQDTDAILQAAKSLRESQDAIVVQALENETFREAVAAKLSLIPIGAVSAFDLPDGCPEELGWFEFDEAKGRFLLGVDGREYKLPYTGNRPRYQTGGVSEFQMSINEMPMHGHRIATNHEIDAHNGLGGSNEPYGILYKFEDIPNRPGWPTVLPDVLEKSGGEEAHNNMPPYLALYFCKYEGKE